MDYIIPALLRNASDNFIQNLPNRFSQYWSNMIHLGFGCPVVDPVIFAIFSDADALASLFR